MNPWEAYALPDPRADPNNWDPFGLYIGPTDYQPDYHGGTLSTEYVPSPTVFAPGSVYTSSGRDYAAAPPATAPPPLVEQVSSDVRWAPESTGPAPAPATTPATASPPATNGVGGAAPALAPALLAAAPMAGLASGGAGGDWSTASAGDEATQAGWSGPALAPPTTMPRRDRWANPIFGRFFATVERSQPSWAALIRALPDARPLGAGQWHTAQGGGLSTAAPPATSPRLMRHRSQHVPDR